MSESGGRASPRIALIGVGRMGQAMARGWARSEAVGAIDLLDPNMPQSAADLAALPGVRVNPDPGPGPDAPDVLVLAVKPQVFPAVAPTLAPHIGPQTLILSIMAGITLAQLQRATGSRRVVRAMPNTPGQVGEGVTGFATGPGVTEADIATVRTLLSTLGKVEGPLAEDLMPCVTAVSGSGPAYVFALTEALASAGEAAGLPPDTAARLARQTVIGAAALMAADAGTAPSDLRIAVTSPGGTTQAGLSVLMLPHALPKLMEETVAAAAARDRELGAAKEDDDGKGKAPD